MPGTAVGLPALPAGGVRSPARGEPVAAQGILLHRFDPAELAAAAASVTDSDDEIPLRPEELTA